MNNIKAAILKYLFAKIEMDFNNRRFESEIKKLNLVLILNPIAFNFSLRGGIYKILRSYNQAIKDFTKAINLEPNNADFLRSRASCYADANQFELAIDDYNKALIITPDNDRLLLFRAQIGRAH